MDEDVEIHMESMCKDKFFYLFSCSVNTLKVLGLKIESLNLFRRQMKTVVKRKY